MKKSLTTVLAMMLAAHGYSQNTFPASGNVGIGTTTPQTTLDVNGSARVSGDISTPARLILTNGAYDGTMIFGNNDLWKSGISTRDASNAEMRIWTKQPNSIYFANGFDGSQPGATLPTDGMKLAANNLGIGGFAVNEAINYKLHVKGTGYFQNDLSLGNNLSIAGNITGNTHFTGDISTPGRLILTNGAYDGTMIFGNNDAWKSGISTRDASNAEMRIWTKQPNSIYFANGFDGSQPGAVLPTDGMKLAANSLGIGGFGVNEAIGYKLHVKGNSKFTDMLNGTSAVFSDKVGIGTNQPDEKLTVKGKIHAEEVKVDLSVPGPDYVFEKEYALKSLDETEKYIAENKHLPEIPSAKTMEKDGVNMGEMQMKLLQKIEELTLHLIEQSKIINQQNERIEKLERNK